MPLTMRPEVWGGDDNDLATPENTVQYLVDDGRPTGFCARIGQRPDVFPVRWQVKHETSPEDLADWHGDYATPEEALAALSKDFPDA